jgi:hypothetical protein
MQQPGYRLYRWGDSELGANEFRRTLSLDAVQTETSKAIVY